MILLRPHVYLLLRLDVNLLLRPDVNLLLRPDVPEHDSGGRLLVPGKEEAASSQKVSFPVNP